MLKRIFQILLVACIATSPAWARTDPFIGRWNLVKLNDQMKVVKAGPSKYAFDFGGGAETIVIDGTQQPANAGTTLSVAAEGPNWKVIRKKGSRILLTATWRLSKNGNVLNDDFTAFNADGSTSNTKYVYERRGTGSGFAGAWVSKPAETTSLILLQVHRYGASGLSFVLPSQTLNVTFDGKDRPDTKTDSALSARRLNARTVEIFRKSKGKLAQTRRIELSPDLKSLTMTVQLAGDETPYVYIFERQ